jgi:hypothetical protein
MCTVAFIPGPAGGYLLGHNRDELRSRARGLPPQRHERSGIAFLAPRDPDGGGTWIGVNQTGLALCLLNAAERAPSRLPQEPRSRGLVLWDLLDLAGGDAVGARLEQTRALLCEVRAFHLVAAEPAGRHREATSTHWTWNGEGLTRELRRGPTMYVSSSYDQEAVERERGAAWRRLLLDHPAPDDTSLSRWLASTGETPGPFSVCMSRSNAMTVSRTLVRVGDRGIEMSYLDGPPREPSSREWTVRLGDTLLFSERPD